MKQAISKSGVYAAANRTLKTRRPEVVALMQKYGMSVSENDSEGKIDKAFFALLPRSRGFRNDFSQLATEVASNMTVGELSMTGYLNQDGTNTEKAFNDTRVGQILSNDAVKNALNLGLSTLAYKATKGGVGSSSDSILNSANLNNQTPPTPAPDKDKKKDDKDKGTDIGWIIALSAVAILGVVGIIIYSKKSSQ